MPYVPNVGTISPGPFMRNAAGLDPLDGNEVVCFSSGQNKSISNGRPSNAKRVTKTQPAPAPLTAAPQLPTRRNKQAAQSHE